MTYVTVPGPLCENGVLVKCSKGAGPASVADDPPEVHRASTSQTAIAKTYQL